MGVVLLVWSSWMNCFVCFFFFQAEDGIRDAQESRGLGDVYKRQSLVDGLDTIAGALPAEVARGQHSLPTHRRHVNRLSLIHI